MTNDDDLVSGSDASTFSGDSVYEKTIMREKLLLRVLILGREVQ